MAWGVLASKAEKNPGRQVTAGTATFRLALLPSGPDAVHSVCVQQARRREAKDSTVWTEGVLFEVIPIYGDIPA